ncbi:cytosol aminopeptidase-like [Brevipalpus obovatus]|uniref:cytosol aminopeptidase-like n=1 Tax=Brevipalpus obovatus TaxID=246614 RepID=UPI003D9EDCCC
MLSSKTLPQVTTILLLIVSFTIADERKYRSVRQSSSSESVKRNSDPKEKVRALIIGAFDGTSTDEHKKVNILTESGKALDSRLASKLSDLLKKLGPVKKGKNLLFHGLSEENPIITVVGLGLQNASINQVEQLDEKKENIRRAVARGLRSIRDLDSCKVAEVAVDSMTDAQSVAEALYLSDYRLEELKSTKSHQRQLEFTLLDPDSTSQAAWERGRLLAEGQNMARRFADMPANLMTPTIFTDEVTKLAANTSVKVTVRDKEWMKQMKMGSFLSVTHGSDEPPKFLEMHYNNKPGSKPIVFVGKGITFDSGGFSLKPSTGMDKMRADMTGAAIVASTVLTLAKLGAKVNVIGLTPLTENLVNGKATKPGDVVRAMNGKTIQIDNTDAEGRLVLADALTYADTFEPSHVIDIATLTGAMKYALGSAMSGVWSTSDDMWNKILSSSLSSGDRVWRMPLVKAFSKEVTDCHLADINNIGKTAKSAGSSVAAAFLKEFVSCSNWMHLDIAGVDWISSDSGYLSAGMTARPFRTIVPFLESLALESNGARIS